MPGQNIFKRSPKSHSASTIGRSSIVSPARFSWRQYTAVVVGLLLLAGGILIFASSSPTLYNGKIIGIVSSDQDFLNPPALTTTHTNTLHQLGVNGERGDIELNLTNDSSGNLVSAAFANPLGDGSTGAWLNEMTAAHIVPMPLLNTYQYVETPANQSIYQHPQIWATAVLNWCKQYCAGGSFWQGNTVGDASYAPQMLELLNEPYGNFFRDGANNPTAFANLPSWYAGMLKATHSDLASNGFGAIGITAAANDNHNSFPNWDDDLQADGAFSSVQGVVVHPYGPFTTAQLNGTNTSGWGQVWFVHDYLVNHGESANANIYATEVGYCDSTSDALNHTTLPNCSGGTFSDTTKDQNIQTIIDQVATVPWIKGLWYFNLRPYGNDCDQTNSQGQCTHYIYNTYGLYGAQSTTPTPAWSAFSQEANKVEAANASEFSLGTGSSGGAGGGTSGGGGSGGGTTPTPPTVSLSAPASGASLSGSVALAASATDNAGIANVQFKLDNTNLGAPDASNPYSYSWNTATVSNGSHTLTAVATDTSGLTATAAVVTVTVNNSTAGGGGGSTPTTVQSFAWSAPNKTLTWAAYPGAVSYRVATVHNPTTTRTPTDYTYPAITGTSYVPVAMPGSTVNYGILPLDSSGNGLSGAKWATEVPVSWPAAVDTQKPSAPTNLTASVASSSQINLAWSAATDNVGVVGYRIYRNNSSTPIATSTSTTFGDSGLSASTPYSYSVVAYDAAGNLSAPASVQAVTAPKSATVTLKGTVTNSKTHVAVAGAYIHTGTSGIGPNAGAATAHTNSAGQYILVNITPNHTHSYGISKTGYRSQEYRATYSAGTIFKNFALAPH